VGLDQDPDQIEAMTTGDRMAIMKAGVLQQLGGPRGDCYDFPKNVFVAQFVGSPPMNLALARVVDAPGGLRLEFGQSSLEIPESQLAARPALKSYVGRSVALGVRSEDMEDATLASSVPDARRIKGKVNLTDADDHRSLKPRQALGSEIVVHFTFSGQPVVTDDTKLIAEETGEGELHIAADEGVKWVASFGLLAGSGGFGRVPAGVRGVGQLGS
jgi:multiple sugar transport system ATP-binding protein